jgi:AraC-like DNA-binding protein
MPRHSTFLSNYSVVTSGDPGFVRDRLFTVFNANHFDVSTDEETFLARACHLQIGGLGLSYCDYTGDVSIGFGEASFVRQIFNIEGAGRYTANGRSREIAPGSSTALLPAQTRLKLDFKSGYRQLVLRIEFDALARYLGAMLGQEVSGKLEFETADAYQAAMKSLRRRVLLFATDFNERGAYFSDLAAAEVERMMIMNFLMCHRHNFTHLLLRQPLPTSPSAVRTVEEFIEANWDKPIDVEAMSAIANVSARSLFRQFKKDRGCTPADFAKRIRLNRAREMLEQAVEDSSVIQIALKCGFQNPGHFARDFRLAFGELPSETLKRSAGRPNS